MSSPLLLGVGTDASAGAWTPASLSGLLAWYKADTGVTQVGGSVSQWNDQSGHGYHLIQATGANQPTYSATGFNTSHPGISLNGSSQCMMTSIGSIAIGTGATGSAYAVVNINTASTPANGRIFSYFEPLSNDDFDSAGSAGWMWVNNSTTLTSYRAGFVASGTFSGSTNARIGAIFDGANETWYINNAAGTPAACTSAWINNGTLAIGMSKTIDVGALGFAGTVAEIVATNTALSSTDRSNLDSYFRTKWGL